MHVERFFHYGTGHWESPYGVPPQTAHCLLQVASALPLGTPDLQSRDWMTVESELQPFGYLPASFEPAFRYECPPGTCVVGQGTTRATGDGVSRVGTFGVRCPPESGPGGATTVPAEAGSLAWQSCARGSAAVGVEAEASGS